MSRVTDMQQLTFNEFPVINVDDIRQSFFENKFFENKSWTCSIFSISGNIARNSALTAACFDKIRIYVVFLTFKKSKSNKISS